MARHDIALLPRPERQAVRVLIIPGLHNSGPAHWQTWLQTQYRGTARVQQRDWAQPDLQAWSARIDQTLAQAPQGTQWIAVAHSFGCLALADHLARRKAQGRPGGQGIASALMVAPADPVKFQLEAQLPSHGLGIPATVIGSENDPWMPLERAHDWARRWGAGFLNLGEAGHINTDSGFGAWPLARYKVDQMIRHLQRQRRLERAHPLEFTYGIGAHSNRCI